MGMEYPFNKEILFDIELQKPDREAIQTGMFRLTKNSPVTWWNGTGSLKQSNPDYVIASKHLKFNSRNQILM
jgi:hypothetical protein